MLQGTHSQLAVTANVHIETLITIKTIITIIIVMFQHVSVVQFDSIPFVVWQLCAG